MNADALLGFWEMPSPSVPGTLEYMQVIPDGKMLSLGRMPSEFYPPDSWFKLWYRYRLTEGNGLVICPRKGSQVEQIMTVEWEGPDTLVLHRVTQTPHGWRFKRVAWTNPPAFLEQLLEQARRELAEWEDRPR